MKLHPFARRLYKLRIVTDPVDLTVEASFDGGETWHAGERVTADERRWLVAGPRADLGDAVAQLTESVTPILRWPDDPEVEAFAAPDITVTAFAEP